MGERISTFRDGDVFVIRLANPARHNAIDLQSTSELVEAFAAAGDAAVIAMLADGDDFCVGGDVRAFADAADPAAFVGELATDFHRVIRAMRDSTAPVVLGARGWATGAGMSLVCAADVVIVGDSALLRPAYPGIGMTPDGGLTWTLPRILGHRRAMAILLGDQTLSAKLIYELGIADDMVADEAVEAQTLAFAARLAAGSVGALAGIKKLMTDGADRDLNDQLDAEAASIAARAGTPEGREGVRAFAERREPDFRAARGGR